MAFPTNHPEEPIDWDDEPITEEYIEQAMATLCKGDHISFGWRMGLISDHAGYLYENGFDPSVPLIDLYEALVYFWEVNDDHEEMLQDLRSFLS
jgi:hypothetical protein